MPDRFFFARIFFPDTPTHTPPLTPPGLEVTPPPAPPSLPELNQPLCPHPLSPPPRPYISGAPRPLLRTPRLITRTDTCTQANDTHPFHAPLTYFRYFLNGATPQITTNHTTMSSSSITPVTSNQPLETKSSQPISSGAYDSNTYGNTDTPSLPPCRTTSPTTSTPTSLPTNSPHSQSSSLTPSPRSSSPHRTPPPRTVAIGTSFARRSSFRLAQGITVLGDHLQKGLEKRRVDVSSVKR